MSVTTIQVQPAVLKWARDTASLDIETAAQRIGVKVDRVASWEDGSRTPTMNQLRSMADVYSRPLAALFMSEALTDESIRTLPDFRSPSSRGTVMSRPLQRAVMRAHVQRDALREIADELDLPASETSAQFELETDESADVLGAKIRSVLGIDDLSRSIVTAPDLFLREMVKRVEDLGVTVIQTQRIETTEMRGFSLGDGSCPIIALNGADWPRGKLFTLLHELAHVGFRSDGLCDLQHVEEADLERMCDSVAAATLMPKARFLAAVRMHTGQVDAGVARAVGSEFGASAESALLRMVELDTATWDDYWRLKGDFDAAYESFRTDQRQEASSSSLPLFYQLKRRDLGRRFINQMVSAYREDAVSSRDLSQLLGVSYDKLPKLLGSADSLR